MTAQSFEEMGDRECVKRSRLASPVPRSTLGGYRTPTKCGFGFDANAGRRGCSPPPAPRPAVRSPLLKAIQRGSLEEVRAILRVSEEDARLSGLEPALEPPLCCAARLCQDVDMLRVLLHHGAYVNETDKYGQSALSILCDYRPKSADWSCDADCVKSNELAMFQGTFASRLSDSGLSSHSGLGLPFEAFLSMPALPPLPQLMEFTLLPMLPPLVGSACPVGPFPDLAPPIDEDMLLQAAAVLLAAGADTTLVTKRGTLPSLARQAGHGRLACFVEYYSVAQVYYTLSRAIGSSSDAHRNLPPLSRLRSGLLRHVCSFLAPEGSDAILRRIADSAI
jgi:hypothetical protein